MSRAWRIEYNGVLFQLMSCGAERSDNINNEINDISILDTIEELSDRIQTVVFASLLKRIHYHLRSEPDTPI